VGGEGRGERRMVATPRASAALQLPALHRPSQRLGLRAASSCTGPPGAPPTCVAAAVAAQVLQEVVHHLVRGRGSRGSRGSRGRREAGVTESAGLVLTSHEQGQQPGPLQHQPGSGTRPPAAPSSPQQPPVAGPAAHRRGDDVADVLAAAQALCGGGEVGVVGWSGISSAAARGQHARRTGSPARLATSQRHAAPQAQHSHARAASPPTKAHQPSPPGPRRRPPGRRCPRRRRRAARGRRCCRC
jgi:hypothetical protein